MKLKRYFRGSGRVLAFVFVASVVWLLFDMAALRLSISEVNTQLLKELVVKERELSKREATKETRDFKHPLQRVQVSLGEGWRSGRLEREVVEVYRKGEKFRGEEEREKSNRTQIGVKRQAGLVDETRKKELRDTKRNVGTMRNSIQQKATGAGAQKEEVRMAPMFTKVPPAVREEKRPKESLKEKEIKLQNKEAKESKVVQQKDMKVPVDSGGSFKKAKNNTLKAAKQDVQPATSPVNIIQRDDVRKSLLIPRNEGQHVNKNDSVKVTVKTSQKPAVVKVGKLQAGEATKPLNTSGVRRSGGLHKVMALDVTHRPRDAQAMGQFGQAAVVPADRQEESKRRWSEGYFNVFLSEQIPVDRAIPDTRPPA